MSGPAAVRRVLMVEDEMMIRVLTTDMLEELGFEVVEAGTAAEALAVLEDPSNLHVALVDLGLPDRPGEDLIHDIRARLPTLPVVVVTGRDASALSAETRALPDLGFLEKPYDLPELEQALAAIPR